MEYLPTAISAILFLVAFNAVRKLRKSTFNNVMNLLTNERAELDKLKEAYRNDAGEQALIFMRLKEDILLIRQRISDLQKMDIQLCERLHALGSALDTTGMTYLKSKWESEAKRLNESGNE